MLLDLPAMYAVITSVFTKVYNTVIVTSSVLDLLRCHYFVFIAVPGSTKASVC